MYEYVYFHNIIACIMLFAFIQSLIVMLLLKKYINYGFKPSTFLILFICPVTVLLYIESAKKQIYKIHDIKDFPSIFKFKTVLTQSKVISITTDSYKDRVNTFLNKNTGNKFNVFDK